MTIIPGFNDEGRIKILRSLVESVRDLKQRHLNSGPNDTKVRAKNQFTVISAPNGWGKTRLVQELYKRITDHPEINSLVLNTKFEKDISFSGYWPKSMLNDSTLQKLPVEQARKIISPVTHARVKNSLPAFMWLGVECGHKQGPEHIMTELEKHLDYLLISAFVTSSNNKVFLNDIGSMLKEGVKDNFLGLITSAGLNVLGASITGILEKGLKTVRDKYVEKKDREQKIRQNGRENDIHQRIQASVNTVVQAGIPLILCIEDLQDADKPLSKVIDTLLSLNGPVFVIATQTQDNALFTYKGNENFDLSHYSHNESGNANIKPLSPNSIAKIIQEYYPATALNDALIIGEVYNSPLICQLLMELPRVAGKARDSAIFSADILAIGIPNKLESIYAEYFRNLNPETQKLAVMLAVISEGRYREWLEIISKNLMRALDTISGIGRYQDVTANWCNRNEDDVFTFYSRIHQSVCSKHQSDFFDVNDISDLVVIFLERMGEEPVESFDEKTVYYMQGIVINIIENLSPTLSKGAVEAIASILRFWFARYALREQYIEDTWERYNVHETEFPVFSYSSPLEISGPSWELLDCLISNYKRKPETFLSIIAASGINPFGELEFETHFHEEHFYKQAFEEYLADFCNTEPGLGVDIWDMYGHPPPSLEDVVRPKIISLIVNDVIENGQSSSVIHLLRSACLAEIDKMHDKRIPTDIGQSIEEELDAIRAFREKKRTIEKAAERDALVTAIKELRALEASEIQKHADNLTFISKLKLASYKRRISDLENLVGEND